MVVVKRARKILLVPETNDEGDADLGLRHLRAGQVVKSIEAVTIVLTPDLLVPVVTQADIKEDLQIVMSMRGQGRQGTRRSIGTRDE